jgi:hypothetical protein
VMMPFRWVSLGNTLRLFPGVRKGKQEKQEKKHNMHAFVFYDIFQY